MTRTQPPINLHELTASLIGDPGAPQVVAKKVRYAARTLAKELGLEDPVDCPLSALPRSEEELKKVPRTQPGIREHASWRSYIAQAAKIINWGLQNGWLEPPSSAGADLGCPPLIRQAMTPRWSRTLWVWNRLIAFAQAKRKLFSNWDEDFMHEFYDTLLSEPRENGRVDLRWFVETVRVEILAGRVPAFALPDLPSKKRARYRVNLDQLPSQFKEGVERVREWLNGELVEDRGNKQRVAPSTAREVLGVLARYLGHMVDHLRIDLAKHSWGSVFTREWVMDWILFTDPTAASKASDGKIPTGITQASNLYHLATMVAGPLSLPEVAKEIESLRYRFLFDKKRKGPPDWLTPDHVFKCAMALVEAAKLKRRQNHLTEAAVLMRDAVFMAFMALFPRRVSVYGKLTIRHHLILRDDTLPQLWLPLEETKPRERDSLLEIPTELVPLLIHYLHIDRPQLLGTKPDPGTFFIAQGGEAMDGASLNIVFRRRMIEFVDFDGGPHSTRKTWTPRFLDWSGGDYLTAMAILDTSLEFIEGFYRDAQERNRAPKFTKFADEQWIELGKRRRAGNE
jgi:hypothetical protein